MYEIKGTKSSLYTEKILIGWTIGRFYIHNLIVFYYQIILTACCTVRTCGQYLLHLTYLIFLSVLGNQCACRTDSCTVTAGFTVCLFPIRAKWSIDQGSCTDLLIM